MGADNDDEIKRLRDRLHDLSGEVGTLKNRDAAAAVLVDNLIEMFREHREDSREFMRETRDSLAGITKQTTETNGRMLRLESRADGHDIEFRDLKRPDVQHPLQRATDSPNAITVNIPMNVKTIGVIVAFIIALAMAGWKAGLL